MKFKIRKPPAGVLPAETREFLNALHQGQSGLLEVRFIHHDRKANTPAVQNFLADVHELDWNNVHAMNADGFHAFFGAALRSSPSGKKDSIKEVGALWSDLDPKDFIGGNKKDEDLTEEEIARGKKLAWAWIKANLPDDLWPSVIVDSGRGYHLYWLLDNPASVEELPKREQIESLMKALAGLLKGDKVQNVDRILRLPGSLNVKNPESQKPCKIIEHDYERRFALKTFERLVVVKPQAPPTPPARFENEITAPELSALKVSSKIKALIENGKTGDDDYKSRSEADMAVICAMLSGRHTHDEVRAVFSNPAWPIGDKYRERGESYLAHSLKKASELVPAYSATASNGKQSQATRLVELASDAELFHSGADGYATITVGEHKETWLLRSKGFRGWLSKIYFEKESRTAGSQALQDAIGALEGLALHRGAEIPVYTRLAEHDGAIYLDLGDADWRAVKITRNKWKVVKNPRVKFRRNAGMRPLPKPVRGGSINDLRPFINVSDDDWPLLLGYLSFAYSPQGPYPLLNLNGEQDSSKSTITKIICELVDPNKAALRSLPREPRDLMISAINRRLLAFDNLSSLKDWLSDAFCRLSTGDGFATRALYSDAEEVIFEAERPIILNGIEELATRPDLLDRCLNLCPPRIPDTKRIETTEFWTRFMEARPRILGALLDATCMALKKRHKVKLPSLPRMSVFARWVVAAEPALGLQPGTFIQRYMSNRAGASRLALDASPLTEPLQTLLSAGPWKGNASQLLRALKEVDREAAENPGWPADATRLSGALQRLAPSLRASGIEVTILERRKKNPIRLERKILSASPASTKSQVNGLDDADDAEKPVQSKVSVQSNTSDSPRAQVNDLLAKLSKSTGNKLKLKMRPKE